MQMSKTELLSKGISPDVVDQIIASYSAPSETPLESLQKALKKDEENSLFKAEEPEGDEGKGKDDDDDMDEEYMKKNMVKYMKQNQKAAQKAAEEAGLFGKKMEKASSDFDTTAAGAVVEMEDLSAYLSAQNEFVGSLAKALSVIAEKVELISAQNFETYALMHKAAELQVATAESIDSSLKGSQGRKGTTTADMEKAKQVSPLGSPSEVYQILAKAMKAGNRVAGEVLSEFESTGKNVNRFSPMQVKFITSLSEAK